MPNKDSFTFSDKLRKSKSVPLSKRLPSIVGGQNKQKRTLVQRAQRDLPFILVAACALLLLPFLSRNGSDDITGPGNFDWDREGNEMPYVDGGGNNIEPAGGMQDPLDLILTPRSAVDEISPEQPRDAYGARPHTDYSTRRSYDEEYNNKAANPPATSKFGRTARPAVRKSVERTPTKTRELRISQMPSVRGATSASHALPTGQAPKSEPSGATIDPGVRPVALQPMGARGSVGRSMTGENLYAEASRSIGAMNAGGSAKANLLASQMKDQDGMMTALGPAGSFGGAGSPRPGGAGGGPNNSNGYNIAKPWWWDMMQTRSQKWWELFEYKWREMLWTNIYDIIFNGGKQIANCLLFGNKDIDVSAFGGKKAAADDYVCKKPGIPSLQDYMEFGQHSTMTKEGGKETGYSYSPKEWFELCGEGNYEKDPKSRKGALQVRLECLGFGTKWLKRWKASKTYSGQCSKVNNDPMEYSYSVTKLDKHKKRLENKTVIVLLAKVKNGKNAYYKGIGKGQFVEEYDSPTGKYEAVEGQVTDEIAVYATRSNSLKMTDEQLKELSGNYCELTRLVAFVSKDGKGKIDSYIKDYEEEDSVNPYSRSKHDDKSSETEYTERDGKKLKGKRKYYTGGQDTATYKMSDVEIGQINAANHICKSGISTVKPFTLDDLLDRAELGNTKKGSFQQCKIIRDTVKFSGDDKMMIENQQCSLQQTARVKINGDTEVKATIEGVGNYNVFAVLLEVIDGQRDPRVMAIHDFNTEVEKKARKNKPTEFVFNQRVAVMGLNPNSTKEVVTQSNSGTSNQMTKEQFETAMTAIDRITDEKEKNTQYGNLASAYTSSGSSSASGTPTARGQGRVIWIVTDAKELTRKVGYVFEGKDISAIEGSDFVEPNNTIIYDVCTYRWCDEQGTCVPDNKYEASRKNSLCKVLTGPTELQGCYYAFPISNNNGNGNDKPFLIANEKCTQGCSCENAEECTPVAWSKDPFNVYKLNQVPDERDLPISGTNTLQALTIKEYENDYFNPLIGKAFQYKNGGALMYPLFPQIQDMQQQVAAIQQVVDNCNIQYQPGYNNNYITPNDDSLNTLVTQIKECLSNMENASVPKTLYFYGYASKKGDTCSTNPNKGDCNKALSEDRNLYLINEIITRIDEYNIGVENINKYATLKGFADTKPINLLNRNSHRFNHSLNELIGSHSFTLVSKPCGSDGAIYDEDEKDLDRSLQDRYVFVSFVDIGDNCVTRINSKNVNNYISSNITNVPASSNNIVFQKLMQDPQFSATIDNILKTLQPTVKITSSTRGEADGDTKDENSDEKTYGGTIKHSTSKNNKQHEEETTGYNYTQYLQ